MNILVLNAGSSSLKYQLYKKEDLTVIASGVCERIGLDNSFIRHLEWGNTDEKGAETRLEKKFKTHVDAIKAITKVVDFNTVSAIGHRVVHSGLSFKEPAVIDKSSIKKLEAIVDLAPLHMPAALNGIKACMEELPKIKNVAVFDTAFHADMPEYASQYAIKYEDAQKYQIKKYGFHGMSHYYVSQRAYELLGLDAGASRVITCHLGNGASVSAVLNGVSVDTSMGLTPLEGLIMGTRSGDIDASVVDYLCRKKKKEPSEIVTYLNKESGLRGVSGVGSDFRDLLKAHAEGNQRASLAMDMFSYRVKKYIGAYMAALNGADAIVFTAGVGEHNPSIRAKILSNMSAFGIELDDTLNNNYKVPLESIISSKNSRVKVLVIPTNEEIVIAKHVKRLLVK
ncbi:MAG: acetate kinase [Firmicutes bacterium]|nr:acetate kinase [Bacillota bacterium]